METEIIINDNNKSRPSNTLANRHNENVKCNGSVPAKQRLNVEQNFRGKRSLLKVNETALKTSTTKKKSRPSPLTLSNRH